MQVETKPDMDARWEQSYRFRPTDPDISRETVARCRKALRDYDWRLDLWWGTHKRRWRIVQFGAVSGNWSTVTYWENADGSYRAPSPSEMLAEVQRLDLWAKDTDAQKLARKLDIMNHEREMKSKENKREDTMKFAVEMADRTNGRGGNRSTGAYRFDAPKMTFAQKPGTVLP